MSIPLYFIIWITVLQIWSFLVNTWMIFNVNTVMVIPTSFVSTFSQSCKHFGTPKMCTFTWCALNMVQEFAWWWFYESKHVATFIFDNKISYVLTEPNLRIFMFLWPCIVSKAWRKNTNKMQQYKWFIVNSRCWLLTTVSTCFGHLYVHHQEKIPRVTAYGLFAGSVGCGWLRCCGATL